ncbi:Pentatricopeptide repeat-containing protein [Canna indica]|uniref:Pentatricopeptide repeat-containing protein n=1 Tax=Canna indica TaxID=4628 RepID=A0AAQ3KG68_9LILI|nr:Pentatricopeptide repeat-containing protein [Canna indica]
MSHKDIVSWTVMICGCCKIGQVDKAWGYFRAMTEQGISLDEVVLLCILSAVVQYGQLRHRLEVHGHLVTKFSKLNKATVTYLVNIHAKLRQMDYASRIANGEGENNVEAINALMMGHIRMDDIHGTLMVYQKMMYSGLEPNEKTIICVIRTISEVGSFRIGPQIHGYVVKKRFDMDDHLLSCLIDVYSVLGAPTQLCRKLFDQMLVRDVMLWTAMIWAYGGFA